VRFLDPLPGGWLGLEEERGGFAQPQRNATARGPAQAFSGWPRRSGRHDPATVPAVDMLREPAGIELGLPPDPAAA